MSTTNDTDTDTSRVQKVYDTSDGRYGRRKPDECAYPSGYLPRTFRFRYSVADKLTEPTTWLIIGGVCLLLLLLVGAFIYANNRRTEGRCPHLSSHPSTQPPSEAHHASAWRAHSGGRRVQDSLGRDGRAFENGAGPAERHRGCTPPTDLAGSPDCLFPPSAPRRHRAATRGAALHTPSHRRSTRRQATCTSTAPRALLRTFRRGSRACTVRGWVRSPNAPLPVYSSRALSCPLAESRRRLARRTAARGRRVGRTGRGGHGTGRLRWGADHVRGSHSTIV